jgi:Fe-S-cluster-containing dehydrogenase component
MSLDRREMLREASKILLIVAGGTEALGVNTPEPAATTQYDLSKHRWGMTIDIEKCIGCGNCVRACEQENDVPSGNFRTWIERYQVDPGDSEHPKVDSPDGGKSGFPPVKNDNDKMFFVPKLCNH